MKLPIILALFASWIAAAFSSAAEKPNFIYILADDLGYGDLGCYGQSTLATPNLDRMAAEGMRFTRHYAGSTVCAPSRCVLLTGKHTGHCSVRGNGPAQMKPGEPTVALALKAAGYRTACIGKWGVGNPPPPTDPNDRGFDYFYGYANMYHAHNCFPEFLIRNGEKVPLGNVVADKWKGGDGRGVAVQRAEFAPDLFMEEALAFIERSKGDPFFLYLALNIPHANNEGGKDGMEVPDLGEFAAKDWPSPEKGFAAMMQAIDRSVGTLLAKLTDLGIGDDTLVIFSSDNGPHQEGGHQMTFFDSNGPLQGKKRDLYEGGIRVPMIARWPGIIAAGSESAHISAFQDVFPTLAELAGAQTPGDLDGISMVPTLLGKGEQPKHPYLYWEFQEQGGKAAVLEGKWKAIRLNTQKHPGGPVELYDVETDIAEDHNLAAKRPEIAARLAKQLADAHR